MCVHSLFRVAPCNFKLSIFQRQPLVSSLRRKNFEDLHGITSVFNVLWFYSVMLLRVYHNTCQTVFHHAKHELSVFYCTNLRLVT